MADIDNDDDNDTPDDAYSVDCPICHGYAVLLGSLGRLVWYRCQWCGMDFNHVETEDHE